MISSFRGPYQFLSNFLMCRIKIGEYEFRSTEAAFQGLKTLNFEETKQLLSMTPSQAKKAGKNVTMRENWDMMRVGCMFYVNMLKFMRYRDLRQRLVDTEGHELIEGNTWGDTYWGCCKGRGLNMLGKTLMWIRSIVRDEYPVVFATILNQIRIQTWPGGRQYYFEVFEGGIGEIFEYSVSGNTITLKTSTRKEIQINEESGELARFLTEHNAQIHNVPYSFLNWDLSDYSWAK